MSAATVGTTISIAPGDIDSVSQLIQRRSGLLRQSLRESTLWAAWFVARAAGASTATSPSKRKVVKNTSYGVRGASTATFLFLAQRDWPTKTFYPVGGSTRNEARASIDPALIIRNKGLAKRAWAWAVGNARRSSSTSLGLKSGGQAMSVIVNDTANQVSVVLWNKLHYAAFALKADKIESIVSRGMNSFRKDTERRLYKGPI